MNKNEESDGYSGLDKIISINIPLTRITEAIKTSNSHKLEIPINEKQQLLPHELYNRKQAAKVLQVSEPTLDSFFRDGRLNYCRICTNGPKKYRREDLEAYKLCHAADHQAVFVINKWLPGARYFY